MVHTHFLLHYFELSKRSFHMIYTSHTIIHAPYMYEHSDEYNLFRSGWHCWSQKYENSMRQNIKNEINWVWEREAVGQCAHKWWDDRLKTSTVSFYFKSMPQNDPNGDLLNLKLGTFRMCHQVDQNKIHVRNRTLLLLHETVCSDKISIGESESIPLYLIILNS